MPGIFARGGSVATEAARVKRLNPKKKTIEQGEEQSQSAWEAKMEEKKRRR